MTRKIPYMKRALNQWKKDGAKPGVFVVKIIHDDWCNKLAGKGDCNCNPDIIREQVMS